MSKLSFNEVNDYFDDEGHSEHLKSNKQSLKKGTSKIEKKTKKTKGDR
jgi:hypothetical protein